MPTFLGSPTYFTFTGASDSTARTIPAADAILLIIGIFDYSGDTITVTIDGQAPVVSLQAGDPDDGVYMAVFVGIASGSRTVAISGGDAGDTWAVGYDGVNSIDTTTPWDNPTTDTASPASIDIATTADGLAVAATLCDFAGPTSPDTMRMITGSASGDFAACATAPGTGGVVSVDFADAANFFVTVGANLRAAGGGGSPPFPARIQFRPA